MWLDYQLIYWLRYREVFYCVMFLSVLLVIWKRGRGNTQSKVAIIYYICFYFTTEIPFRMGHAPPRPDIYFVLFQVSFFLILFYHTLDITKRILQAMLIELLIMVLDIIAYTDIRLLAGTYSNTLGKLNYVGFLLLMANWWDGSNIIYRRLRLFDYFSDAIYHWGRHIYQKGNKIL